jgi:hypothetical protein
MLGHSIGNIGYLRLHVLGIAEEEITETQAFVAGLVVFVILLLTVTILANLLR